MSLTQILTGNIAHRPWPLPQGSWAYYQEWNRALLLHWKIPVAALRPIVPEKLELDTLQGTAWISLVAFTMERIRPRLLPAVPPLSNFHELNLRTYVSHGGKKGVYFLGIEAEKAISAFVARRLSGLPYRKASMNRFLSGEVQHYNTHNKKLDFRLHTRFTTGAAIRVKEPADTWLTERYCLYAATGPQLFRFDIHHEEWPLHAVTLAELDVQYRIGDFDLSAKPPDLVHYSPGVKVLAWHKVLL